MAERVAPSDYNRLHHFVSDGIWDEAPLERELATQADQLVGGADAFLVIDDTALPKKGAHSGGRAAMCVGLGQDGKLPNLGVADAGAARSR